MKNRATQYKYLNPYESRTTYFHERCERITKRCERYVDSKIRFLYIEKAKVMHNKTYDVYVFEDMLGNTHFYCENRFDRRNYEIH